MLRFTSAFSPLPKCLRYDGPRQKQNFLISVNIVSRYPFPRISVKQMFYTHFFLTNRNNSIHRNEWIEYYMLSQTNKGSSCDCL